MVIDERHFPKHARDAEIDTHTDRTRFAGKTLRWTLVQWLLDPRGGMPPETLIRIIDKAEREYPRDFSTRLYVINNEIAAWRDLNT